MQSRFFLPGVAPDVTWIAHAFAVRFLEPLVKLILVLVEPVTAKDIAPRKRSRGRFPAMFQDHGVIKVDDDIPVPGGGECIGRVQHPRRARDLIALAQEMARLKAAGEPTFDTVDVLPGGTVTVGENNVVSYVVTSPDAISAIFRKPAAK